MPRTLYICYFGLHEPLVQTQVLPYLRELRNLGGETRGRGDTEQKTPVATAPGSDLGKLQVTLLTFEPEFRKNWTAEEIEAERERLAAEGIEWHATGYHKWPSVPATFFDILNGTRIVWSLMRRQKYDVLHGRVHIPTLMGAVARKFSRQKPKLLFDIRGFFPEEYTDAGRWPEGGWLYRAAKRVERWLLKESDGFVVLTEKAREILFPESKATGFDRLGRPVEVIPCCVSFERLRTADPPEKSHRFELVYAGSVVGLYMLEEMGRFFLELKTRRPDAFFRILTAGPPAAVNDTFSSLGISPSDFAVEKVPPEKVFDYLQRAHLSISFRKPTFSQIAASPTKVSEYLAAGLPVVCNRGIGDTDRIIEEHAVGVIVDDFEKTGFANALDKLFGLLADGLRNRCIQTARNNFDLSTIGGRRYERVYLNLFKH